MQQKKADHPFAVKKVSFHWDDPLRMDLQLSNIEKDIQRKAFEYAQEVLLQRVTEAHRAENYEGIPLFIKELGARGFLGINLHGFGFRGLNHVCYGLVARELERVDSAYRTAYSVQSSLATEAIYIHGSEEQKTKYLPGLAKGELIACFGLTEPDHGSDPGAMETRAKKVNGGYQLNGHKKWIGLATMADVLVTWAKDDDGVIRGFVLEKGMPGIRAENIHGKFCLRAAPTCEYWMDDVFIPEVNVLPKAKGLSAPFMSLNMARFSIAWGAIGAAEACWKISRDYVLKRNQFDRPLGSFQLIQSKLADMETEIALMSQACLRVARLLDEGQCAHETISLVKRCCARRALDIAMTARDMLGANGIVDEHHVIRHVLNLMAVNTYEGTEDVQALILGRAQTGISAFR